MVPTWATNNLKNPYPSQGEHPAGDFISKEKIMSENEKQGGHGKLIFWAVLILICRLNLPDTSVSESLDLSSLEQKSWFEQVAVGVAATVLFTDAVADWKYHDLLVVKAATSKRLGLRAIRLPFGDWKVFQLKEEEHSPS
tara:strand:+ start:2430 stop:2849 length:420 start_codon:yes stop_codon:yes gene_type:complete